MTAKNRNEFVPNATAASLLGFLHEKPMTGWELLEIASERIGNFWSLTSSQVYSELEKLAGAGLVNVSERGQRNSRTFTITRQGRKVFADWWRAEPMREQIRFPMLLTVSFGRYLEPDSLRTLLQQYRKAHSSQLAVYRRTRSKLRWLPGTQDARRTLAFGISYETMTIKWIDTTLKELGG